MSPRFVAAGLMVVMVTSMLSAVEREVVVKKVNPAEGTLIVAVGDQERTLKLSTDVPVLDAQGKPLAGGLKAKELEGATVTITVEPVDGTPVVKAIRLAKQGGATRKADTKGPVRPLRPEQLDPAKLKIPDGDPNKLPRPGIGLFFKASEVQALRAKAQRPPCQDEYARLVTLAEAGLAQWTRDKADLKLEQLAPQLPDLIMEFIPAEHAPEGGKAAGKVLTDHATRAAPAAAFVYLLNGERRYADYAWEVFQLCGKANRWGWFPWAGAHMPQIHYGIVSRNLCLIADCVWGTLTPQQRQEARETIARKCVEPYFRIVLHTPGMALYHLRSRNQGNNALAAALIGSLFVGDAVPDNEIWFNSLMQTYHWIITHDIGWMGQNLESGMPGYWSVSMQNLYTAAVVLHNIRNIDLRAHPGFDQATWYPIIHEATVPPLDLFRKPIPLDAAGPLGIISGKPVELPHVSMCGSWWFDYAMKFPDSPAHYFASKTMVDPKRLRTADPHQGALSQVLTIAWWDDKLFDKPKPPSRLALFTDRMAGVRSGYEFGDTYLYFNGDLFLSAKKEVLAVTSGLSWHFPWHQYQIAESGIETEGELFAPSMLIKETRHDAQFTWFRAESGFSNVAYYPQAGQRESYKHYDKCERNVLYVRGSQQRPDYFVFLDNVQQAEPRWHAWTWHLWNSATGPENYGRFVPKSDRAVRAERPNADLWIEFLVPSRVQIEQHGIPGQPNVQYEMDHNVQMMRAVAGDRIATAAKPLTIPPAAWQDVGVVQENALFMEKPPTQMSRDQEKRVATKVVDGLVGGTRYRCTLKSKKENYRAYEATAWAVELELLNQKGEVIARPTTPYGQPHPLRLGCPLSNQPTHDWVETAQYFDAPVDAVACRATFHAVGGAHYFQLGKLWLGAIELQSLGKPERTKAQQFVTLVMPLNKKAPTPKIEHGRDGVSRVIHPNGEVDDITTTAAGTLNVTRRKDGRDVASFSSGAKSAEGSEMWTNSDANARRLAAGLKPLLDQIAAARDRDRDRPNLALKAKVTASASRDERFSPDHVVDNQTAEYPRDGHLDYRLGIVWSSGRFVGYGSGKDSLLRDRDYWPLYVKPTYWLLPEEKLGHIELELPRPADVDLVRILNTSNAGLNDFATHTFRIELRDRDRKVLATKEGSFGKVFDRPFTQAFKVPKWFDHYTPSFEGMLEPGLTVPFGDGWREITFDHVKEVVFVRVIVTKYWGIGGGLNEIQVYAK